MSGAPIRAAGASGRPQCRPSSTAPTWRATNRTRRERRDGSPPQSRSGGHPPRQIDRLSDQVATSTFQVFHGNASQVLPKTVMLISGSFTDYSQKQGIEYPAEIGRFKKV